MKTLLAKLLSLSLLGALICCGPKAAEHAEGAAKSGASFQEGKGIQLTDEAGKSLGVEITEVTSRALRPTLTATAQVYRAAGEAASGAERPGFAYASAMIDGPAAAKLKVGQTVEIPSAGEAAPPIKGRLFDVDQNLVAATGKAEVLVEFPDAAGTMELGRFIQVRLPQGGNAGQVVAVPGSAVLDTAMGKFAYVQNGPYLLRTSVATGSRSGEYVEIADGLYEGDSIASSGAENLYLIELRATKGGGHSH